MRVIQIHHTTKLSFNSIICGSEEGKEVGVVRHTRPAHSITLQKITGQNYWLAAATLPSEPSQEFRTKVRTADKLKEPLYTI